MERKAPVLAADDHPPSPPPPPTPAPISEPPTPADHPTPAEPPTPDPEPEPELPQSRPRQVRRSARIRGDSDRSDDQTSNPASDIPEPSAPRRLKRISTDNTTEIPDNQPTDVDNHSPAEADPTTSSTGPEKQQAPNDDATDLGELADDNPTAQSPEAPPQDIDPSKSRSHEQPGDGTTPNSDDGEESNKEATADVNQTENVNIEPNTGADNTPSRDDDAAMLTSTTGKETSAPIETPGATPHALDDAMSDDDVNLEKRSSPIKASANEPTAEQTSFNPENAGTTPETPTAITQGAVEDMEKQISPERPQDHDDPMDVDEPRKDSGESRDPDDVTMEVERPAEAAETVENPEEPVKPTEAEQTKPSGDLPPAAVTDSEDEIRPSVIELEKSQSPPVSPPRTRRQLARLRQSSSESSPDASRSPPATPKTVPRKPSRRSESSDAMAMIEKSTHSRYETRSSRRGSSPVRTRQRRHSEPVPVTAPASKPRTRRPKKYSRKPIKGDRLRVLWHIDNIYYEGVVDSVLALRGKRFYDITYDSGEREYYLELTHRKWRFADGRDGDDHDAEEDDEEPLSQKDIDFSRYPQIGERILVMWHVDGKYYPGKVNDILKANGGWFYDVDYEGGDREFFLDLTIRKWKYPNSDEDTGKNALGDQKNVKLIGKSKPKPTPKPKAKPKPKPKRVARKTIGPGSSSFAAGSSSSQSPPRPSRRIRTLEMLLDDQDGGQEQSPPHERPTSHEAQISGQDELAKALNQTSVPEKEARAFGEAGVPQTIAPISLMGDHEAEEVDTGFDIVLNSFGGGDKNGIDEMEPPLSSQPILKRPRTPNEKADLESDKLKENDDVSDFISDLLRKSPLSFPDPMSEPMPPSSPPPLQTAQEKRNHPQPRAIRPPSPFASESAVKTHSHQVESTPKVPPRSGLKRKLAERPISAPAQKRQSPPPRIEARSSPRPQRRRLRTIKPTTEDEEVQRGTAKASDDPNVAEIVSVAGIVARKWAREEVGIISGGLDKLKRQISSLKRLHSKSLLSNSRKPKADEYLSEVLPDDEAEAQVNALGTNVVTLVRKYRNAVEEREKRLRVQFTRMRTKITRQNEGLMETAEVLSQLDIDGIEALKGLQPKTRKKLEIPAPLQPRQSSQAYTQPPNYALSSGVPMQQFQGFSGSPGTLGQHDDAVVRNLRRRLADLVTRSEWLGEEVKRLQGREKTLFREKSTALAELRKAKRTPGTVDLTPNGKSKGLRSSKRTSLPPNKPGIAKLAGIAKRKTRGTAVVLADATPLSKGGGKALRKSLPRSNLKYKAPQAEPQPMAETEMASTNKATGIAAGSHPPTRPTETTPVSQKASTPAPSSTKSLRATDAKTASAATTRKVPSTLQIQMDKQASDLIALTFTVWLLQDESRSEPPTNPGERMDAWVRGCVKKCLNSALSFLTDCGGIFRARSSLKADVDNESIYTDWILAPLTDDAAIEKARENYSLWDPSLRDFEWQAEKRVLRGLTICYQKALALTPAANFTATLMYAEAILKKSIRDFESLMPATITAQPSKLSIPAFKDSSIPKSSLATPTANEQGAQNKTPLQDPIVGRSTEGNGKHAAIPASASSGLPAPSDSQVRDGPADPKEGTSRNGSALNAPVKSNEPSKNPLNSSKPVPGTATPQVSVPPPGLTPGQNVNIAKRNEASDVGAQASQSGINAKTRKTTQVGVQTAKPASAASGALGHNNAEQSKDTTKAHQRLKKPPGLGIQQESKTGKNTETSGDGRNQSTREDQIPLMEGQSSSSKKTAQGGSHHSHGSAGQEHLALASLSVLKSGPNVTANESRSSEGTQPFSGPGRPSKASSLKPRLPTSETPQGSLISKSNPLTTNTVPSTSGSRPALIPMATGGGISAPASKATSVVTSRDKRDGDATTPATRSVSKGSRTSSRTQSRGQGKAPRKTISSAQGKRTRAQETRKHSHQIEPVVSSAEVPPVSAVPHAMITAPLQRMQEIPRKHMTLGAPTAPLELPKANQASNTVGLAPVPSAQEKVGTAIQRTYPMLSRNQIRASSSLPTAALLSKNQITAGKRPSLGTAQMSVPAAPVRRTAPGMQTTGEFLAMDVGDPMDIDLGRELNKPRRNTRAGVGEQHDGEAGRGSGTAAGTEVLSPTHRHVSTGFPDDSPLQGVGRQENPGGAFHYSTGGKKIGFKSLPMVPPRQASHSSGLVMNGGALHNLGSLDRSAQNAYEAQRTTSAPTDYTRTSEAQTFEHAYGQGGEHVYSPYNTTGQDRDLPVELMNPPTPSSLTGLDGYGYNLNADHANRDSLPATPSDFDRYGAQSSVNLERSGGWGTTQQQQQQQGQGQGQLGHLMNPQPQTGGYNNPQAQAQAHRYQTRGSFHNRR